MGDNILIHLLYFIRHEHYHHKGLVLDLEKLPSTSSSIQLHIKRCYYQTYLWLQSPIEDSIDIYPEDFGYILEDEILLPKVNLTQTVPEDLVMPCTCVKCARKNVCPCRKANISCCEFCKCQKDKLSKNDI